MKIQANFKKGGYSTEIASNYIDHKKPIYSLSTELYPQQRFENNQPTGEIIAYLFKKVYHPSQLNLKKKSHYRII